MPKRLRPVKPLFDDLIPLLIPLWRKKAGLPGGPSTHLQTREFRSLIAALPEKKRFSALLYDYPLHYAQGISLLSEIPTRPNSVLEIGSDFFPFALSALSYGASIATAIGIDLEKMRIGAEICGKMGHTLSLKKWAGPGHSLPQTERYDLVVLGHTLFSLFENDQDAYLFVQECLQKLTPSGHLLLVESSLAADNRRFLALRERIADSGCAIQAPCIWQGNCPALKANSFCYAQRPLEKPALIKEIQRASNIHLSSLKMSYLLIKSSEQKDGAHKLQNAWRTVSPIMETIAGKKVYLCGVSQDRQGGAALELTQQQIPVDAKAFQYLKRGDVIAVHNAHAVANKLMIKQDTQITLVAPFDKPIN